MNETEETVAKPKAVRAVCVLRGDEKCPVKGIVLFKQAKDSLVKMTGQISGLQKGLHGFHIHEFGDNTNGCTSAGDHFNPLGKDHGDRHHHIRHVGDLGNVEADAKGVAKIEFTDSVIQLSGEHSIIGRSLVIHADCDDLGQGSHELSKTTGNAGTRLACGIIGLSQRKR